MLASLLLNVSLQWLLVGLIACLSAYWLWSKTRRPYTKFNIPPFPVPPLPVVGHLLMVNRNLHVLAEWQKVAGDIFSVDLAGKHQIVICGYDLYKEVLVKNADKVPDIPLGRRPISKILNEDNKGILGASGSSWKEQRTVSLGILRNFGMGKNILAERIQEEVKTYVDKLASLDGAPSDVRLLTNISVSNVICAIIVGKRFEHDDPYFIKLMHNLNKLVQRGNKINMYANVPLLWHIMKHTAYVKTFAESIKDTNETFSKAYIKETKKTLNYDEEPSNFIAAYLIELKKRQDSGEPTLMDEQNLVAIIRNLFAAGTETTSTTILWCFAFLLHHPDVQEKVYSEIETQVGTERAPTMQDKPKLTYLSAVIMETQRMASLVPIGTRRAVKTSFEVRGYTLPEGSIIIPYLHSVLHDAQVWGDPEKFRPERFLGEDGNLLHPDQIIPFSVGRRACLGEALAKMEIYLFLSFTLQRFHLHPADELPSLIGSVGITNVPSPFQVRFVDRRLKTA